MDASEIGLETAEADEAAPAIEEASDDAVEEASDDAAEEAPAEDE